MKTLKCLFVLIALIGLLFAGCSEKSQPTAPTDHAITPQVLNKVDKTYFSGTDLPKDIISRGETKGSGQRTIIKWMEGDDYLNVSDPRVSGVAHIIVSSSTDENLNGQAHGKFTLTPYDPNVGGIWEGTWNGYVVGGIGHWKLVAHGSGGSIHGMQLFATETYNEFTGSGDVEGYVQSH